jgi:hypothetical protein
MEHASGNGQTKRNDLIKSLREPVNVFYISLAPKQIWKINYVK